MEKTAAYRTTDPLDNFRLRVRLRRVSGHKQQTEQVDEEVLVFRWQQKFFSRKEEEQYLEPRPSSPLEQRYHRLLLDQLRANGDCRPNLRLFSCIEEDVPGGCVPEDLTPLTTAVSERVTNAVRLRSGVRRRRHLVRGGPVVERPTVDQQAQSRVLSPPPHTMLIMADLGGGEWDGDEHMLCQLKAGPGGVVSLSPDLSQGPKWCHVESAGGELFEYRLEHASTEITGEEHGREERIVAELSKQRTEHLKRLAGSSFEDPPLEGSVRVQVLGELVSGRGFSYDDLYVSVSLGLPEGCVCTSSEEGEELTTVSQICRTKSAYLEDVAHFCLPLEYQLELPLKSDVPCSPVLYFEVAAMDSWDRQRVEGYGQWQLPTTPGYYDVTVATWRPMGQTLIDELRRLFVGGGPQLEDVASAGIRTEAAGPAPAARYGLRTESSGSLHLRISVLHHSSTILWRNWHKLPRVMSRGTVLSTEATLDMYRRVKARLKDKEGEPHREPHSEPVDRTF